jgi:hypothetical protein
VLVAATAFGQGFPQDNVSTGGPTPAGWLDAGNPLKQMNEPDCAVSPGQPNVVVCGMNDYSGVDPNSLDVPELPFSARSIGDSSAGIAMSTDGGRRWIRGLHPCHFADDECSIGQQYMADPNLSAVPGALFYSVIAGFRDGTGPGGLFMFTWLENNSEVGPPYIFHSANQLEAGTGGTGPGGKFLDKPGQTESLAAPGTPSVPFQVPDPDNPGMTLPVSIPAGSIHFVYSVFVGNDNNPGTKVIYNRYDNWDFTAPSFTTKITEGTEINQGAAISTRDNGSDTMIVWRRFKDNNEEASVMYVTCNLTKCSKPKVLADFCPHDQTTGRARYRMLALPVVTHDEDKWYVFYSDRGDGNTTCFDSNGVVNVNANGIPAPADYSRVMMATWNGQGNNANWDIQPVDPQLEEPGNPASLKIKGHQVQPAAATANAVVQVIWDDTRDSRLYTINDGALDGFFESQRTAGTDRFIEDYVLAGGVLRPARFYEPDGDPPLPVGTPFRHSIDVWGRQITNGSLTGSPPSFKISRYAVGRSPFSGNIEQLEHSFPGARLFRQGTRPFYADYKTVAAAAFFLDQNGDWKSKAGEAVGSISNPPVFYAGFTDNRRVRGNVYYDGCNESTDVNGCANTYEIPNQTPPPMAMAPLDGAEQAPLQGEEDPSVTPAVCTPGEPKALSRNQKVFVAPIRPGLALSVVSARKPANSTQDRTFVLYMQNSTPSTKTVTLSVPATDPARWNRDTLDPPLTVIDVNIPPRAGAVRTLFVSGDPDGIIVTATDNDTGDVVQALINGNVDLPLENFDGVLTQEDYTLRFLGDRVVSTNNQDLENQDLENTLFLQDLENDTLLQDLENASILQDLENQDLENLFYEAQDLENQDLENQDLENRALYFQDLENQDLENDGYDAQDLENETILFQDLENQDLENQDLENGAPYTEISWPVDSESNTTVGINAKVIAAAGSTDDPDISVQVFVTQSYLTHTVSQNPDARMGQFCTPQVVADNQVVYNTTINGPLDNNPADDGLDPEVISFYTDPGVPTTVTVRVYGDPDFNPDDIGLAVYAQAGDAPDCTPEVGGDPTAIPGCEIDFNPDLTPPEVGGFPTDPPSGSPFSLGPDETTYTFAWGPITITDDDPTAGISCSPGTLIASDPTADPPTFTFAHDFPIGTTTVTCTVSDSLGNSVEPPPSFTVTIEDNTAPVFTAPPVDIADFEATGTFTPIPDSVLRAVPGGVVSASDAFPVTITNNAPPDPSGFPIGTTIVTWTATDDNGNASTATQNVTVVDTTAPVITAPADPAPVEASGVLTPVDIGLATATDISEPISIESDAPLDGFPVGTTVVTWTATDAAGNASTATQTVTVTDTTAPAFTSVPPDITDFEATGTTTPIDIGVAQAVDLAGGLVVITNNAPSAFPLGLTTVTWTATDSIGNFSTATQLVTVVDTTGPTVTAPADVTAEASGVLSIVDIGIASTDDVFAVASLVNDAPAAGFPVGTTVVTWTATDDNGNESTDTQNVTVVDTTPPTLSVSDFTIITLNAPITVDYADYPEDISANDLVDLANVTISCTPVELFFGDNEVSCTATDTRNNSSDPPATLIVRVEPSYIIEIDVPRGNINAGSTLPIDFRYLDRDSGDPIDSSGFEPSASWAGYSDSNCSPGNETGVGDGSDDAGSSNFRPGDPDWQYSWQTPVEAAGSYLLFTIVPPEIPTDESSICVRLR